MARRSAHAEKELYQFLRGALLSERARRKGDESQITGPEPQSLNHPDVSDLAGFFYGSSSPGATREMAAHVALCHNCAEDLAAYARAERLASEYLPSQEKTAEIPAAARQMISDWEESSFARPRSAGDALDQDLLDKLSRVLAERKEQMRETREAFSRTRYEGERPDLVPVVILDREGEFRGVEIFEKATGGRGSEVFKHAAGSGRFDKKPFHALMEVAGKERIVVSDFVRRDKILLQRADRQDAEPLRADYFIIED